MKTLDWTKRAEGVWSAQIGSTDEMTLLGVTGLSPKKDGLEKMGDTDFPLPQEQITSSVNAGKTVLSFPFTSAENLYGLGLNFNQLNIRGTVRHLHVDHYGGKDNGRTHAPVPFYVSSKGYGVFINIARYISVYIGTTHRKENHPPIVDRLSKEWKAVQPGNAVEIIIPAAGVEVIVFGGPTPLDAIRRFNLFCGGGCLPPRWGLGFWQRVPMAYTDQQAEQEADEFAEKGFPLDVIGLEPGWHSQAYPTTYEWHSTRFPSPKDFVIAMKEKGVRINLWENAFVSPESTLGRKIEPFCGSHTGGWGGIVPDLMLPEARELMANQHETEHLEAGVSGYKLDECDGYDVWVWPDHATFPSGATGEQMRQVYGVLLQRLTTEMFRKRNTRTYGLVRGSNAGAVSFPYVIYNDYYSHRDFITALCNSSFCGLLWTPEARGSRTAEEWLRRMQSVCFSPLAMINAWADGTKPWSWPEVTDAVRKVMLLRMRLIPYLYSAFARYHFDGTPPFRAMVLEKDIVPKGEDYREGKLDSTEETYNEATLNDVKDQYMMGDSLLVAPIFAGEKERKVVLPSGKWFDFYTGEAIVDGQIITVTPGLDKIPLFVRDGGIIPLMPPLCHVPNQGETVPLEVRHYGSANGCFQLYDDDGVTFNYEQGKYHWRELKVCRNREGVLEGHASPFDDDFPSSYSEIKWRFMTDETVQK